MRAPRERPALDPREAPKILQHAKLRHARLATPPFENPHPPRLAFIFTERLIHRELRGQRPVRPAHRLHDFHRPLRRQHHHEREINFADRLRLELPAQEIQRHLRLRAEQHSARVRIEPMDVGHTVAELRMHEPHQILPLLVPTIGRNQQPARFVERDERLVFLQYRRQRHAPLLGARAPSPAI